MPCPHCGLSSKATSLERRDGKRSALQRVCDILKGEVRVPVKTVDVSSTGLGIKMLGYLPFEEDELVDVQVDGLDISTKARVVWTKKFYGISRAGLFFIS